MEHLCLVVPTKDRPDDLRRMLASLADQTRLPDHVVVVDGSDPPIERVLDEFPGLSLEYVRVFPPSLAAQRNAGMARLRAETTLAGYLDDDVVLEPDAIANMMQFWATADSDIGGAAFHIVNNPAPRQIRIKQFFGIDGLPAGRILSSGFPTTICNITSDSQTDWLYGGATVWRRKVIEEYPYDEWFIGTGFMEDVDYSFCVRSRYRLYVIENARLAHYSRPVRPDRQHLLGIWQVVNRMYFVRKHSNRGLSIYAATWASVGLILLSMGFALIKRDKSYFNRAMGNISGLTAVLFNKTRQLGGHLK